MEDSPAAATQAQRGRPNPVVERKLGELDASLADAMASRLEGGGDVGEGVFAEIQARIDFLRTLILAEGECHGGAWPEHLFEAEARLAVLQCAFDQWPRPDDDFVVAAPADEEEERPEEAAAAAAAAAGSGSACSCTDSCCALDDTGLDVTSGTEKMARDDVKFIAGGESVEALRAARSAARRATLRRWRRSIRWCAAAGVVAVVALGVGLAVEFAAVASQNVYVVPT